MLKFVIIIVVNFSMFMFMDNKFIFFNVKLSSFLKFFFFFVEVYRVFFSGEVNSLSNVRSYSGLI